MAAGKMILAYNAKTKKNYQRSKQNKSKPKVSVTRKLTVTTPAQVRRIAKRVLMGKTEQKYVDFSVGKIELNHNSFILNAFRFELLQSSTLPVQGDTDNNRDGNRIYVSGISVPMMLYTKGDRLNTKFRVICLKYRQGYDALSSYANAFDNITGNVMLDKVNPDKVKVVFDKIVGNSQAVTNTGSTGNDELVRFKKYWIPIKKTITFTDDGVTTYNSPPYQYCLIVMAFDTFGSLITDNIGAAQAWTRLYFKDL